MSRRVSINEYCSTYHSLQLFFLSWKKVEMKTHKSLPYFAYIFRSPQNNFWFYFKLGPDLFVKIWRILKSKDFLLFLLCFFIFTYSKCGWILKVEAKLKTFEYVQNFASSILWIISLLIFPLSHDNILSVLAVFCL